MASSSRPSWACSARSEEHTSELQSLTNLVCRLLLDSAPPELSALSLHDALPILESLILALLGGIAGCLLALPMNGVSTGMGNMMTFSEVAFNFRVTPALMLDGIIFAAVMGLLGEIGRAHV